MLYAGENEGGDTVLGDALTLAKLSKKLTVDGGPFHNAYGFKLKWGLAKLILLSPIFIRCIAEIGFEPMTSGL